MERKQEIDGLELEIPQAEQTPTVKELLRIIAQLQQENRKLREEIDRLKGLPPKPQRKPSMLGQDQPPQSGSGKKAKRRKRKGKRPGSTKRKKTSLLRIDEIVPCVPENLPHGAVRVSCRDWFVQDLEVHSHNICYRREVYRLSDGTWMVGLLPEHVQGHFGATLHSFVLYQHYHNQVTQPLIHEQLLDLGVDISSGQVDRILHHGHEAFAAEKETLLEAAREVSKHFHTDDTSAKHRGKNGHTTVISNEFFASFTTSDSKSRLNFLEILRSPLQDYVVGPDALFYMEWHGLSQRELKRLESASGAEGLVIEGAEAWERQLDAWNFTSQEARRIVTEGALFGCLMGYDLYVHQPIISDDAGQFKILGYMHALCWLHAERNVARVIPMNQREHNILDRVRSSIWNYFQSLKAYREAPTERKKRHLQRRFDELFLKPTGFVELNEALSRIQAKKEELLLVLEHPDLPLDNNMAERDLRQWAKLRKVSSGTRSSLGRKCRDIFLSLRATCRKLGISFWQYLQDRKKKSNSISSLAELIHLAASESG